MQELAGVLLEMGADQPDRLSPSGVSIVIAPPTQKGRSYCVIWYPFGRSG